MLQITSLSVQDRLSQDGRKQAFVMELAGPHDQGEFVVEIDEAVYGRLLKVYEAVSGKPVFGEPVVPKEMGAPIRPTPVPSATDEEIMNIQAMLLEEENKVVTATEIGGAPQQFAGKHIGPAEAAMLQGIGMELPRHNPSDDVFGYEDDEEDDAGELFAEDSDQL